MIRVESSTGTYPVYVSTLSSAIANLHADCYIVTDENVARYYGDRFAAYPTLAVPPGEQSKSIETFGEVQSWLAASGANRKSTVVAIGGGVVGDLAGFAAATFMRGATLIQIPTTLLAQVDSSVGGKVGIDLPEGKNLVGAFFAPESVYLCTEVLDTLPPRELHNGMAEVWKYVFIAEPKLVGLINSRDYGRIAQRCIEIKAEIVKQDEFEQSGVRAKLNFGHTVGHAIEKVAGYRDILHGEAISLGMVAEAKIGEAIGVTLPGTWRYVDQCLRADGLPTTSLVLKQVDSLVEAMRKDKKASGGRLAFSLVTSLGNCTLVEDVPESEVRRILANT